MNFEFKKLPYAYDSLEPYIDAKTMELHHSKHHKAYYDKFVDAIKGKDELQDKLPEEIVAMWDKLDNDIKMVVRNNGGGFINHNLFWEILKKEVPYEGTVAEAINNEFGSFDNFKKEFTQAALTQFGSGWAWLVVNNGKLEIVKTSNQDTPLSEGKKPILTLDVWEHAYYLKYQNKRPEYVENFFNVINWNKVDELYNKALK